MKFIDRKVGIILGVLLLTIFSFWLGGLWNASQYDDWCLDMGGDKKPGNHEYCIIGDISENENFITNKDNWVEAVGVVTESTQMLDGTYAYTLEYDVTGSDAVNIDRESMQGPLPQFLFNVTSKAVEGREMKLQYDPENPNFFEILEGMEFIKEN
jgi:hypothetical protein